MKLRAWWAHRQGLDGLIADAAEVLVRTGWMRSVGGSAPYLGMFARAGLRRAEIDAAVADVAIHELPSARGCTYVLPAEDYALGLKVGAGAPAGELAAATKHLDVTAAEIDKLGQAVVAALADGPLDPAGIKSAVGDLARSLGDAGRKRGMSNTLPLALGMLQASGEIRRVPVNGRLDQQRYRYVQWSPPSTVDGDAAVELAVRYFRWAAPASLKHFRWFSGFSAAAAKKAIAELDLVPLQDDLLMPAELVDEYRDFVPPDKPQYALVAGIDGIHLLHRDIGRLLDPADADRQAPGEKPGKTLGVLADPPCHLIVDRGRIVGLWEFDPDSGTIAYEAFVPVDDELRAAVARTEAYAREDLGDVRSFSLDSPKSRAPRLHALRAGQSMS
jgi:hypothetical protein